MSKHWLAALCICSALAIAGPPALAAGEEPESDDPGELARDGLERLMRAFEVFIDMIPQYEMPEIDENGDIIIRRKRESEPPPEPDAESDVDQTQT